METHFFYGPDKAKFELMDNGMVAPYGAAMPFHGIISRGLLNRLTSEHLTNDFWHLNAHKLETGIDDSDADAVLLKQYAAACKVLGFGQSAQCVQQYLSAYLQDAPVTSCEVWNIKEGHTTSVWKITVLENDKVIEQFVVNVARDEVAGGELKDTAEKMQLIAKEYPDINMARVHEIATATLEIHGEETDVVVTRNQLVEDSYEIHQIKDKYILVDRFLTKANAPSNISAILGRAFAKEESLVITKGIKSFQAHAKACLASPPQLNINDGDVVWSKQQAIVIAIS